MAAVAAFLALQALGLFRKATELPPEVEEEIELEEGETPSGLPVSGEAGQVSGKAAGGLAITAGGLLASLASGALDASGNAAFLAASSAGPLMLVSVVTSLYPALTVLLARAFFGQRLGARRAAGLALALAGVSLIGMR
jgi:drug/metabolite transporter (DMT)-like permease